MINFFVKTYGCQANVADSSHLKKYLQSLGCIEVTAESEADFILINTCAIREKAESKMFSYLGSLVKLKREKPHMVVGVIGCVASYRKEEIKKRFVNVDFVFGAREDIENLKAVLIDKIESIATAKSLYSGDEKSCEKKTTEFNRSMINIMRGCNNYCSYCIVPFTTGRERSYSIAKILDQIKKDVDRGIKEITLLGQNVNSYKDPDTGARFEALLDRAAQIDGEFWIRFVSPHPKDMTTDVLDVVAKYDKLCSYIHLPMQSGSNKILKLMNRTYTIEEFRSLVDEVRKRLPHATLSTDIIVGFPGETEDDYRQTRKAVDDLEFQTIYSFIYSPRKYTKAALLEDNCSMEVKHQRLKDLQAKHREIGTKVNRKLIGKTVRVLLEERKDCGTYVGRTEGNIRVFVTGAGLQVNRFVDVEICDARLSDITGVFNSRSCQEAHKSVD